MAAWGATQAKAKFSEVLDKAETEGPQLVRRRKREFFVLTREQREELVSGTVLNKQATGEAAKSTVAATESAAGEKPFVSGWDALRPSFELRDDIEFPRLKGKLRAAKLG